MGKREIRPLATPKPLNRSSQKNCITWRDYVPDIYPQAKFSHDRQGVSFPHMREIAHQRCLLGFFLSLTGELQTWNYLGFQKFISSHLSEVEKSHWIQQWNYFLSNLDQNGRDVARERMQANYRLVFNLDEMSCFNQHNAVQWIWIPFRLQT